MDINYLNSEIFPSRGITWYTEFSSLKGLNSNSGDFTKLTSDMTIYASISDASRVTGVIRAGGGHIFSSKPEYFQALTLGVNNYVRGFRKNRFAGTSMAYGSAELRFKVAKSRSYLLPGDIGLIGFYDIGRVWQRGEHSDKWHDTYGGGIYFVPYNVVMLSATMGISEEDQLFNFTLGTKLTLTF
jgi:outer membrane protein assembly factor BamA